MHLRVHFGEDIAFCVCWQWDTYTQNGSIGLVGDFCIRCTPLSSVESTLNDDAHEPIEPAVS